MKKVGILEIIMIMVIGYASLSTTLNINGNSKLVENISDFKVYLDNVKVNGEEVEVKNNDTIELNDVNGNITYDIVNDSTEYDAEVSLECSGNSNTESEWTFDYTGNEQTFTVPKTGTYKLETWGAQGGSYSAAYYGGYGGYSVGQITLNKDDILFINVGGTGNGNGKHVYQTGGYNGGGHAITDSDANTRQSSGGGATHIATNSGLLSTLEDNRNSILIVSGGGGGSAANSVIMAVKGGSGGGIKGNDGEKYIEGSWYAIAYGGTQIAGGNIESNKTMLDQYKKSGSFGLGATTFVVGGGGGFYGGGSITYSAGGGSGYIGNTLLTEKSMYCYNCTESNEEETKTISTTCANEIPIENCSKIGNGYAKITQINTIQYFSTENKVVEAQDSYSDSLNNIEYSSLTCKLKVAKISRTEKAEVYKGPTEWTFNYTGSEQTFTVPISGTYKLETWGAQGGVPYNFSSTGGLGAYASGNIKLSKNIKLYVYVGGAGENGINSRSAILIKGGYNGGGSNSGLDGISPGGGGATDIRLVNGSWDNFASLKSRIIVAGGGAGAGIGNTGAPGGQNGGVDASLYGENGSQTKGGSSGTGYTHNSHSTSGSFGKAGNGGYYAVGAGGSGYYGGGGGAHITPTTSGSGGGGSSFISGHTGCNAISEESTETQIIHTSQSNHYSGYIFNNTEMIDGAGYKWTNVKGEQTGMPSFDGLTTKIGNVGNGYAKITLISID